MRQMDGTNDLRRMLVSLIQLKNGENHLKRERKKWKRWKYGIIILLSKFYYSLQSEVKSRGVQFTVVSPTKKEGENGEVKVETEEHKKLKKVHIFTFYEICLWHHILHFFCYPTNLENVPLDNWSCVWNFVKFYFDRKCHSNHCFLLLRKSCDARKEGRSSIFPRWYKVPITLKMKKDSPFITKENM